MRTSFRISGILFLSDERLQGEHVTPSLSCSPFLSQTATAKGFASIVGDVLNAATDTAFPKADCHSAIERTPKKSSIAFAFSEREETSGIQPHFFKSATGKRPTNSRSEMAVFVISFLSRPFLYCFSLRSQNSADGPKQVSRIDARSALIGATPMINSLTKSTSNSASSANCSNDNSLDANKFPIVEPGGEIQLG